ncbi:hypothetical protein ENBRE01_2511 [Enteropsectra breve]|nr:hypothetical protein ENBRE01_2511 [Enteropsectra breve]
MDMSCFKKSVQSDAFEEKMHAADAIKSMNIENDIALIEQIYYLIWSTAKWRDQIKLIDRIIGNLDERRHRMLLDYIICVFPKIESDRTDKFFYFIKSSFYLLSFKEIVEMQELKVLEYIVQFISQDRKDFDNELFLNWISTTKPWIADKINNIKIEEKLVRPYLNAKGLSDMTRAALFRLFKN